MERAEDMPLFERLMKERNESNYGSETWQFINQQR